MRWFSLGNLLRLLQTEEVIAWINGLSSVCVLGPIFWEPNNIWTWKARSLCKNMRAIPTENFTRSVFPIINSSVSLNKHINKIRPFRLAYLLGLSSFWIQFIRFVILQIYFCKVPMLCTHQPKIWVHPLLYIE